MDSIDLKIIDVLKENSRSSTSEISRQVKLSIPAVAERIRKLEEAQIIEKYTIKVNREKTKHKLLVFIFVTLSTTENIEYFRKSIVQYPSVLECHHITGEYDYLLKVLVEDTKSLEHFLSNSLKKIKGVHKSSTVICLTSLKETLNIGEGI